MENALLTLEDVACDRGGLPVLEGVSLALGRGEAVILRGPNGSGKTTLLRTVAGLQPPAAGRVIAAPETIAYAAHADGLKGTLTAAENLSFWAGLFGSSGIDTALAAFDLTALRDRRAQSLSAGQRRRLGLARLLVTGRKLWALDEPTVSLDSDAVALFARAVEAHLAGGGAALVATHVDLRIDARVLNLSDFRAAPQARGAFGEALA